MSQNPPESTGSRRRLNREYKRNVRQGTKDFKAAATLRNRDLRQFDRGVLEAVGRSNLTPADLSTMMQRSITGTQSAQARSELAALGQAAQGRVRAPRVESPTLAGMVGNAYSRWRDARRGAKLMKAAGALTAKDAKTIDPVIRAQLGHSTMTRADLAHLAQRNFAQAFRSPGDFEVSPGEQAPQLPQGFMSREDAARGAQQADAGRLDSLRDEIRQLREQIALLEQQVAQLESELQQAEVQTPEVESPEVQTPEAQQPEAQTPDVQSPEAQTPEAQQPEAQSPDAQQPTAQPAEGQSAQTQQPEAQSPQAQQPEGQAAEAQQPEVQSTQAQTPEAQRADSAQNVGQHQAVPTDRAEAQQWVSANTGENQQPSAQRPANQRGAGQQSGEQQSGAQQPAGQGAAAQGPRGTAQPVFQAAGGQPTTRPGQPQRPAVEQPVFQAAGEQPNESIRKAEIARAAAAAYDGTANPRAGTAEQAAKTAESDPNKRPDRGTGQSAAKNNDPNGRGAR